VVLGELIIPGRNSRAIAVTVLLGMAGALLGRFLIGLVGGTEATQLSIWTILWATVGALVLIAIYRLITSTWRGT
jgi:uncharacterized membrane protein YeaQ/YmgE (transglycosylase-associated protein family)